MARHVRAFFLCCPLALPFKGRVGWGWCWFGLFFSLVIPAKAGIQLLAFCLDLFQRYAKTDSRPCVVCPPSLAASHFLLLAQEKVTQEKGTLAAAVCRASMPGKLRKRATEVR